MSKWFIPFFCLLTLSTAHANPPEDLYEKAILTSPLVTQMHEEGLERRTRESQELQSLLDFIASKKEMSHQAYEDTKRNVREWFERMLGDISRVNKILNNPDHRIYGNVQSIFIDQPLPQLVSNQMTFGLRRARAFFEDSFDTIMDGELPEGLSIAPPKMNTPESASAIYATGGGITLKHLLLATTSVLGGFNKLSDLSQVKGFNPSESVFIHTLPFPRSRATWHNTFDRSFYGENGFTVVHNGYGFEGQRGESTQKRFGPHNAATLLEKHMGKLPNFFTTDPATYVFIPDLRPTVFYTHPRLGTYLSEWQWRGGIFPVDTYRSLDRESLRSAPFISEIEKVEPGMIYQTCFQSKKGEPFIDTDAHAGVVIGSQGHGPVGEVFVMGARRTGGTSYTEGLAYFRGLDYVYGVESFRFQPAFDDSSIRYDESGRPTDYPPLSW